jgi:hypothetical protein
VDNARARAQYFRAARDKITELAKRAKESANATKVLAHLGKAQQELDAAEGAWLGYEDIAKNASSPEPMGPPVNYTQGRGGG